MVALSLKANHHPEGSVVSNYTSFTKMKKMLVLVFAVGSVCCEAAPLEACCVLQNSLK